MKQYKTHKTSIFKFERFESIHEIKHFVSTRAGGVSKGPFEGLNLGFGAGDAIDDVLKNRYLLAEALGTPLDWFVFPRQTHSANIKKVDHSHLGLGATNRDTAIADTDALISNCKNLMLAIQVADCVPVLLFDPDKPAIAAIHAGWRGTADNIVGKTVLAMQQEFGSAPSDIIAAIGPSIGPCCYEVGVDFLQKFDRQFVIEKASAAVIHLDLWKANKSQLLLAGVDEKNIETAGICTNCTHNLFFSSRHGNSITGRFVAGIMLQ